MHPGTGLGQPSAGHTAVEQLYIHVPTEQKKIGVKYILNKLRLRKDEFA